MSRALLAHAFCAHWRWLTDLPYQPKANCFSASFASWKPITFLDKDIVRCPMRVVNYLIYAALRAVCTRKKIVSGTDALHRTLQLETCRRERSDAKRRATN